MDQSTGRAGSAVERAASWKAEGDDWTRVLVWRRDKHRRPHCDLNLGHNFSQCHCICSFSDTVTAQTDNTKYVEDSNELTLLCAEGSGRGLIKVRPFYFLDGLKTFTKNLTPNNLCAGRSSNWAPQQQKSNFSMLNNC